MLLSSDEEIIVRKSKVSKKRNLENLFDSEEQSEEFSMIEEEYSDNLAYNRPVSSKLFVEIFGTGKEYLYAVESLSSISEEKIIKEFEKPRRKLTEDMLSFLIENLEDVTYSVLKTVSELILDGACVEFLVIGKPELNLDIYLGYKIFDLIEYYFNNLSVIEKLKKTGKLNLKYLNLISKKEFVNEGNQFVLDDTNLYKTLTKNNLIINKNKFKENILEKERIYAPDDIENEDPLTYINTNFLKEKPATKTEITNYLANEFSKDTLLKDSIINLIVNSAYLEINQKTILFTEIVKNSFYDLILELRNNNYKILFDLFSVLNNFFINNNFSSKWNDFRKEIIQRFIKKFDYENILRTRFLDNFKEIGRKALRNNIIDRVVNGRVAHCNFYIGVTVEKFNLKCSVVDYIGELREFRLINLNDRSSLSDLMDAYEVNELFISDTTPKSKKTLQNLDFNLKYVESNLIKRYSNSKNFTQNIIRMIISPETELAYMVNKGLDLTNALLEPIIPNKELLLQTDLENIKGFNEPCENEPNEFFFVEFLSVKEREEVIRRSLQTAISIVGVDINIILHNERRRNLVDFMPGFYISDKLKEFNFIERINILESALEGDKNFNFRNAATFLRAYVEKGDKLDEFSIHPYTYKYARMVCAAARDKTETDDVNLSADVKEYLEKGMSPSFDIQKVSHMKEVYDTFVFVLGILNQTNKYFEGLPDKLIFNDLIGEYKLGVYEGIVAESQKSFAIVSVKDCFSVFVRKNPDQTYYYNQIVKVRILEKNIQFLSFLGEIIPEDKKETNNLEVVQDTFYIRKSKKNDFYYLFINLEENLTYPLKLEYLNDKILVLEKYFDDLEELKVKFIRPLFLLLNKIKKNEFFFNNQKEAEMFINQSKEQIKYAFYLSREYPGRVVFEFDNGKLHKEYLKLANKLIYNNKVFSSLEEFLEYRKSI